MDYAVSLTLPGREGALLQIHICSDPQLETQGRSQMGSNILSQFHIHTNHIFNIVFSRQLLNNFKC